ncbi:hypothetical protein PSU4_45500 [Pseudonocardia sulfidoxydans NBRC 16205]|uniref:DUF3558 domain-containing protein n=3 Tax=Pseudonocardia sulfidoxydans TaxID=54011 RepID=A0A511DLA4_9PSEU|nr:hypothetical protein PSU4_45500 [Pseudonocardia sulfidoxydans NBRC 16205]
MRLVVFLVVGLMASGCVAEVAGTPTAGSRSPGVFTDADPDPCGLLSPDQRRILGVGDGEESTEIPLEGARFCRWENPGGGPDWLQGGVLPSAYRLADVKRNYPSPKDELISGLPALSTSSRESIVNRSCLFFAELPDGRLATVSYFWNGRPERSTREEACGHATSALELIIATARSR